MNITIQDARVARLLRGDGEQLPELREEILALVGFSFNLDPDVGIVCVPSGLQLRWSENLE